MATFESKKSQAERRQHLRIDRNIRVKMYFDSLGYDVQGETRNLSAVGTYCEVNRPIPEMTQLMLVLNLPTDQVECGGTVVRSVSDPARSDLYHLAIFFNEMSEKAKRKLNEFIEV